MWNFRLFGIPVTVEPVFWLLVVFLGAHREKIDLVAIWVAVCFVSILAHELGHALAVRRLGISPSIRLHSMGGLTTWPRTRSVTPGQYIFVSFAGPLAGFLLAGAVWAATPWFDAVPDLRARVAWLDLLWVNVAWGCLNLLPILPLDGGNIMMTAASLWFRREERYWPYVVSTAISGAGTLWAVASQLWWTAVVAAWFCWSGFQVVRQLPRTPLRRNPRPNRPAPTC
jgi:Zn-dependent protease